MANFCSPSFDGLMQSVPRQSGPTPSPSVPKVPMQSFPRSLITPLISLSNPSLIKLRIDLGLGLFVLCFLAFDGGAFSSASTASFNLFHSHLKHMID